MSQILFSIPGGSPGTIVQTLTGNSGGAVGPTGNNINVVGSGNMTVTGNPGTSTLTVTISNSPSFSGTVTAGTGFTATTGDVTVTSGNLLLPTTSSSVGQVRINNTRVLHAFGSANLFLGAGSGNFTLTGSSNTVCGAASGTGITSGIANTIVGWASGASIAGANNNTIVGAASAASLTSGGNNTILGNGSGTAYTSSEASNILIGRAVTGVIADANTLRIGSGAGTGVGNLNRAFIHGIRGITTGVADAIAVLVDSAGQLGTVSSSARVKENVRDLGKQADKLVNLRPVSFNYKTDETKTNVYGLIAEEVKELFPELVVYNKDGEVESIKYHELPILLLKKVQDLVQEINNLKEKLGA